MFTLSCTHKFHLYTEATDIRIFFDGLSVLVQGFLQTSLIGSSVFEFINKQRDKVKLLHWVGGRYLLYYRQLEEGKIELHQYEESHGMIRLSHAQMVMLTDGISIVNINKPLYLLGFNDVLGVNSYLYTCDHRCKKYTRCCCLKSRI